MNDFYVYIHKDKAGNVRYVGKGRGKRAWDRCSRNKHWHSVFNKHELIVEIAINNLSEDHAYELETMVYDIFIEKGAKLTNISRPDGVRNSGWKHTKESRKKLSEAHKGQKSSWYGKHLPDEMRHNISEAHKGKKLTAETRNKISLSSKGNHNGAKLTVADVATIREMLSNNIQGTVIARKFNVSNDTIYSIKHGKNWKHLKVEDK